MKRKLQIAALFVLLSLMCYGAPFGLKMGMSIDQIDPDAIEAKPGIYIVTKVPKPHSAFDRYVVRVGPETGLFWIKALGGNLDTDSFGIDLRFQFYKMKEKLEKVYGECVIRDELFHGSIWNDPNDFMMSLLKGERILACLWDQPKGEDDIESLTLLAKALKTDIGYIAIEYSLKNMKEGESEISALEDGVL